MIIKMINETNKLLESFKNNPGRKQHLEKLADAFYENLYQDDCEFGGWGIDSKRPFGNSYVEGDIAYICGLEIPSDYDSACEYEDMMQYLKGLYSDLGTFIKYRYEQTKHCKY